MTTSLRKSTGYFKVGILVQLGLQLAVAMSPATAATMKVTNTLDSGTGTLRAAVTASVSGDTIVFDCSASALNCPATITLSSQGNNQGFPGPTALVISGKSITIQGPASGGVTLRASHGTTSATSLRLFFIDSGASLTLQNLTLSDGKAIGGNGGAGDDTGGGAAGLGGAIFSQGELTLSNLSFSANNAIGGEGGILLQYGGFGGGGGLGGDGGGGSDSNFGGGGGTGGGGQSGSGGIGGFGGDGGPGLNDFGGGIGGMNNTPSGAGSNGGGGGGGVIGGAAVGGSGSDGGGGGGGQPGGRGGFGGGGGYDGVGGFGGGGGSCGCTGAGISGGVGGGTSHSGYGGGGGAFGGAIFARSGSLTLQSAGVSGYILGNGVSGGSGAAQVGSGLFLMSGINTTFDISGKYTILDSIGDDSAFSLSAGGSFTPGNGAGAGLMKQGAGTLILAGTNTYAGTTIVNNGSLRIMGSIAGSYVNVAPSGALTGDGSTGAIDSAGIVAPGTPSDAQGELTAKGLTLESGSLSCFHALGSSATSSHLNISGAAIVAGFAHIDFATGPTEGATYTLLQAPFVTGSFDGFETNMPDLYGTFSYGGTNVTFTVIASDVLFRNGFEQSADGSPCAAAFAN